VGLVGVYRGSQLDTTYARLDDGKDETRASLQVASQQTVQAGQFYALLPPDGDIHYVKTVSETPSVSIHLLANDTGCVMRHKVRSRRRDRYRLSFALFERELPARTA